MQTLIAPLVPEFNAGILSLPFIVKLDNTLTVAQLKTTGNYYIINRNINDEKFPVLSHVGQRDIKNIECITLSFPFHVEDKRILWEMEKNSCRPGNLKELMMASEYPDIELPLVAIGSVWENPNDASGNIHLTEYVPYIWKDSHGQKGLGINWLKGGWSPKFKFLGVKL